MKKIESHFETQSGDAQRINLTFVLHRFVANFVSYICAKYCLNWFSFHIVIMNVIGVNFFWNTVYISLYIFQLQTSLQRICAKDYESWLEVHNFIATVKKNGLTFLAHLVYAKQNCATDQAILTPITNQHLQRLVISLINKQLNMLAAGKSNPINSWLS